MSGLFARGAFALRPLHAAVALAVLAPAALAQSAKPLPAPAPAAAPAAAPQKPADPRLGAAQTAFEALPEAERKAIQDDLIWAARYTGGTSGSFGTLTFGAITGFQAERKLPQDGILSPPQRKVLAEAAARARKEAGFIAAPDGASGARIGVPTALLSSKAANTLGGMRWQDKAARVTLDTASYPASENLQQMFDKATLANVPGRKITYKLIRPDFFVISGETAEGKFYRRVARGADGTLRGFSIGYAKADAAVIDRYVIAIAASFDPFPGAAPAVATAPTGGAAHTAQPVVPAPPPAPTMRILTGYAVRDGMVVTSARALSACKSLSIGPARLPARRSGEAAEELAALDAPGVKASPLPFATGPASEGAVLFLGEEREVIAAPARFVAGTPVLIDAALQPGGAGGLVFDRHGALLGLVAGDPGAKIKVAGVVPAARYPLGSVTALAGFGGAGAGAAASEALTTGAIARTYRAALMPISCGL